MSKTSVHIICRHDNLLRFFPQWGPCSVKYFQFAFMIATYLKKKHAVWIYKTFPLFTYHYLDLAAICRYPVWLPGRGGEGYVRREKDLNWNVKGQQWSCAKEGKKLETERVGFCLRNSQSIAHVLYVHKPLEVSGFSLNANYGFPVHRCRSATKKGFVYFSCFKEGHRMYSQSRNKNTTVYKITLAVQELL